MKKLIYTLFVLLLLTGCSDKIKLGGKVTFPDGEPLETGTILFSKSDFLARAHIKPDGTYDVGSLGQKDGLPAGTYKVFITGALKTIEIAPKGDAPKIVNEMGDGEVKQTEGFKPLIAQKYTSEETTPLTVTVPSVRAYNITVERP